MLSHKAAIMEAKARFGDGTSRFNDFMIGWHAAASTPATCRTKNMRRHGSSLRHRKRPSHF